jgi:single-strand DNA-binding protein
MADLNRVYLMGRLTRDPEVRYTPKGTAVGDIGIAINRTYKTQDGSTKEETCYVDIEVWGRQAETCKEYLAKGREIFVEGSLKFDQWEQDGQKKSKLRVRADRVQFIGGRGEGQPKPARSEDSPPPPSDADAPAAATTAGADDDDIPF